MRRPDLGNHMSRTSIVDCVTAKPEITPRDKRIQSGGHKDADPDRASTVTRDGHRIGEPASLCRRRRFVPRSEFAAMSRTAPEISLTAFRADQDAVIRSALPRD